MTRPAVWSLRRPIAGQTDNLDHGDGARHVEKGAAATGTGRRVLLLLPRTLDRDACCLHEGGCPPQLLQVTPPRWPSGKASASRAEDPGFESPLAPGFFRGRVIPVTQKLALLCLPCQAPGVIGSALGLVGQVSVYCDWVR